MINENKNCQMWVHYVGTTSALEPLPSMKKIPKILLLTSKKEKILCLQSC